MKFVFQIFVIIAFGSQIFASEIEDSLTELAERLERENFRGSLAGLADNFPIYTRWEQAEVLSLAIEKNPVLAAAIAVGESRSLEERIILVYVASTLPPAGFVEFWEEISHVDHLDSSETKLIEYGIHLKGGMNLFTLTFNHEKPRIASLLSRIQGLVEDNERASTIVAMIANGQFRDAQKQEFSAYGPDDWESLIPNLELSEPSSARAEVSRGIVDTPSNGKAKLNIRNEVYPPKTTPIADSSAGRNWLLAVIGIAVFGILILLLRAYLRSRTS